MMNNYGCFFVSDSNRIKQAYTLISQIRNQGYEGRIGALLLTPIEIKWSVRLADANVEFKLIDKHRVSNKIPKSGLKLWIPYYFSSKEYLLLDTDIIMLSTKFISFFRPQDQKAVLVSENNIFWQSGKKRICDFHRSIIGKTVIQTGAIGITRELWERIFPVIWSIVEKDPSEFGDMAAINIYFHLNPSELYPVDEENCLVLRTSYKGPSTRKHLKNVCLDDGIIKFKNKNVLALHYTNSAGLVCTLNEMKSFIKRYSNF